MRIRTLLLAAVTIVAGLAPSHAATLPRIAGVTTVTADGFAATLVSLPRAVTVDAKNPSSWIRFAHPMKPTGGFMGILIDNVNRPGSAWRPGFLYLRMEVPPCAHPMNGPCTPVETIAARLGTRGYERPWSQTFTFHPGTYRIYVLGNTRRMSARLTLPGLSGIATIPAKTPFDGYLSHDVEGSTVENIAAHPERHEQPTHDSSWSYTFPRGPWLLVGGQWRSQAASSVPGNTGIVSTCWQHINRDGFPDYWWKDPDFLARYTSPGCSSDPGTDRAFAWSTAGGEYHINFKRSPVTAPNAWSGFFALPISLLDSQL